MTDLELTLTMIVSFLLFMCIVFGVAIYCFALAPLLKTRAYRRTNDLFKSFTHRD